MVGFHRQKVLILADIHIRLVKAYKKLKKKTPEYIH